MLNSCFVNKFYFFWRDSYNIMIFFCKILLKNTNSTYEFTLKEGLKVKMENFLGTKN